MRLKIGRFGGGIEVPIRLSDEGLATITIHHDPSNYAPLRLLDAQGSLVTTNAQGAPTYMPWTQAFDASIANLSPGRYAVEAVWTDTGETFRWEGEVAANDSVEVYVTPGVTDASNAVPFLSRTSTFIGAAFLIPLAIIGNFWLLARKRK